MGIEVVFAAALCAVFFFYGLNAWGFLWPDDSTYAQVAREMMQRNDWVTPTLHGQPWLEKPILYYWLAIVSFKSFGVNDGAARLPAAVAASCLVFAVLLFLRRLRPGSQRDAALAAASSVAMFLIARTASMDMLLAAAFTTAMMSWFTWLQSRQRRWLSVFYLAAGIGVLAKGPVAPALAAMCIVVFLVWQREPRCALRVLWETLWLPGIALFLVVSLPWYWMVQQRNPDFAQQFLLVHNLIRFQKTIILPRPWWFFLPLLPVAIAPWTAPAFAGAWSAFRKGRTTDPSASADEFERFLAVWAIVPVIFFSLSKSKLPHYLLPTVPAWTTLAALYWRRGVSTALAGWHALTGAVGAAVLFLLPQGQLQWGTEPPPRASIVITVIFVVAGIPLLWWSFQRYGASALRSVTAVLLIAGVLYTVHVAGPVMDTRFAVRGMAREFAKIDDHRSTIATYDVFLNVENGMTFYRDVPTRRVELFGVPDEGGYLFVRERTVPQIDQLVAPERLQPIRGYPPLHIRWFRVAPKSR